LLSWYVCADCHHVWADGVQPRQTKAAPAASAAHLNDRPHIVVVDDDFATVSLIEHALVNYRVSSARDGKEGLVLLSNAERVDLLITDYLMPGMTGAELVSRARLDRPKLPVLIVTGHGKSVVHAEPEWWTNEPHLSKPFRPAALTDAVERILNLNGTESG
jgi:CheY-like chemotaxis protein